MSPQDFLAHFHEIANAPGGVARLRELIRSLAIRGQLVEHVTESVDPDSIRVFVDAERQSLVKQGLLRPTKKERTKSYPQRSLWLPEHWTIMPLGEVTVSVTDGDHLPPPKAPQGFPFLVISDVRWGKIDFDDCRLVTSEYFQKLDWIRKPIEGDLLFTLVGSFGIPVIVGDVQPFCVQRHIGIIKPSSVIDVAYLACALGSADLFQQVSRMATGTAQKTVPLLGLRLLPIPLPPLAEQKRIVAKVAELMALCDALEAQQQERARLLPRLSRATHTRLTDTPTQPHLDSLFTDLASISPEDMRRTIQILAIQGKLLPQNPSEESASNDLMRIGISHPQLTSSDPSNSLPSNWLRLKFEDVAIVNGGVTLGRNLGQQKTVELPYLRVANVKRGGFDLSVIKTIAILEAEIERYALRKDDLLMTEGGDWDKVGRAAIWKDQVPNCLHQNHVFRSRFKSEEVRPEWFELFFNSPGGRAYFESCAKQTTNLASINMRQVKNCPIPFPPLAEQRRIVAKVNELMALVATLEAQQQEKSRLAEAFAKQSATNLIA